MKVEICPELHGQRRADAWDLYTSAFTELNALAIQRHLMTPAEFDDMAGDPRIHKYCAVTDGGILVGLSVYTNELDAWPLISAAYFERHWPALYAERKIWYCGFVATHPDHPGLGAYQEMVEALYRTAEREGGLIVLDVCRYNDEEHRISRSIKALLTRISDGQVNAQLADQQSFWTYHTKPVLA